MTVDYALAWQNFKGTWTEFKKAQRKAYRQRPEVKAKRKAYTQRPEMKAQRKAYNQAYKQSLRPLPPLSAEPTSQQSTRGQQGNHKQ